MLIIIQIIQQQQHKTDVPHPIPVAIDNDLTFALQVSPLTHLSVAISLQSLSTFPIYILNKHFYKSLSYLIYTFIKFLILVNPTRRDVINFLNMLSEVVTTLL